MQVYCQAYKQAAVGQAHGLLRKARRLDAIINIRPEVPHDASDQPTTDPKCYRCHAQFSPAFYPEGESWLCHKCHFDATEANGKTMGMMAS